MNPTVTIGFINQLRSELLPVRASTKAVEFLTLLATAGTTSAQVQTWLTTNAASQPEIFRNRLVVEKILSNTAQTTLVYNAPAGAAAAMASGVWINAFLLDPDNVNTLMASTTAKTALASSEKALDALNSTRTGTGAPVFNRFLSLSTEVVYTGASITAGTNRPIPELSGRNILLAFSYDFNNVNIRVTVFGRAVGTAASLINIPFGETANTFATYDALSITPTGAQYAANQPIRFRVIPIS